MIMDFPSVHFPCIYKHVSRESWSGRQLLDNGGHMNVDVDEQLTLENGQLHCVPQKTCQVSQHLPCGRVPCLPLSTKPEHVSEDWEDDVSSEVTHTRGLANILINKVRFNSGRMKNASRTQYHINMMEVGGHVGEETAEVRGQIGHSSLQTCVHAYSALQDKSKYLRVNSAYTGGCVCTLSVSSSLYLVYAAGQHRDRLCVQEIRREAWGKEEEGAQSLLQGRLLHQVALTQTARQIHASYVNNVGYCCVRTARDYSLYEIARDGEMVAPVCLYTETAGEDTITSITSSPYISGEMLMATDSGCVHLTNSNNSTETLLRDEAPRFEVTDPWRQVHWGAHPRQFVLADRTCLQIFDARSRYGEGVDLFAQPSGLLHQGERLMVTRPLQDNPYLHLLASDFTLMLLDQRLPKYPVMLWRHTLGNSPQYLCPVPVDKGYTQVLLASQLPPAQTHCYTLHNLSTRPVTSHGTPYKLASVRDLTKWSSVFVEPSLIEERLNPSLVGVAGSHQDGRLLTFQLTSYGEVFYQTLSTSDASLEPEEEGGGAVVLSKSVQRVVDTWLSCLNDSVQNTSPAQHISPIDVHHKLPDEVRHPHVLCALCLPLTRTLVRAPPLSPKDRQTTCNNCGHSLELGQRINADKTGIEKTSSVHEDLFDANVPMLIGMQGSSANSRLLTSLWQGKPDIQQLLQARNKERQVLQQRRKEKKAERLARRKMERDEEPTMVDKILAEQQTHRVIQQDSPRDPHLEQCLSDVQVSSNDEADHNMLAAEDELDAGLNIFYGDSRSVSASDEDIEVDTHNILKEQHSLHPTSSHSPSTSVPSRRRDISAPVTPHRRDSSTTVSSHRRESSAPVTPHRRESSAPVTPQRQVSSSPVTPQRKGSPVHLAQIRRDIRQPLTSNRGLLRHPSPHVTPLPSTPVSVQSDGDEDDLFFTQQSLEMFSTPGGASIRESDFIQLAALDSQDQSPDKKKRTVPGF